jgi:hypothetical protein
MAKAVLPWAENEPAKTKARRSIKARLTCIFEFTFVLLQSTSFFLHQRPTDDAYLF